MSSLLVKGRKLPFYELVCAHMNINFMLKFELKDLRIDDLTEAIKLVKRRHPYMRMRIRKNDDSSMEFYEESEQELNQVQLKTFQVDKPEEFESSWKEKLIKIANTPRDNSESLSFFEVYSCKDQHQLYAEINHSGIDGPGVFTLVRDICAALDDILSHKLSQDELKEKYKSREFCEIHKEYRNHSFDLEELKNEPLIKENFVKGAELRTDPSEADVTPHISCKFYKLDEPTTQRLIANTKKNNSTIQGLLSAAHMITLFNDKPELRGEARDRVMNAVPCNMRDTLEPQLTNDDLVCAAAPLIWPQEVNVKTDTLWSLSSDATKHIKQLRAENYGTKWFIKAANMMELQPLSIMCSSIGMVSLNESSLQNFKITDLRFMGGIYVSPVDWARHMTHAFSFANKFTLNFSFPHPRFSQSWAGQFSGNVHKLLLMAANDEHLDKKPVAELLALLNNGK